MSDIGGVDRTPHEPARGSGWGRHGRPDDDDVPDGATAPAGASGGAPGYGPGGDGGFPAYGGGDAATPYGRQAAPAADGPAAEPPRYGTPTYGTPTYGTPSYGTPSLGGPADGTPSYGGPAGGGQSYGAPAGGAPGYGPPAYGAPAPPVYGASGFGPGTPDAQSTTALPAFGGPATAAGPGYGGYGGPPPPPPSSSRGSGRRTALIVGLVVVLVAGLGAGAWALFFRGGPAVTWQGREVDAPEDVLSAAQRTLDTLVTADNGAKNADTRCYFSVPKNPPADTPDTDVTDTLYCGPALFVDGDTAKPFITYGLTATPGADDTVALSVTTEGTASGATGLPSDLDLVRPDGASPPDGSGGLTVPAPPPAEADTFVAVDDVDGLPDAPDGATMAALDGGVTITKLGEIDRYGSGADARSAPDGQKLIAFDLTDSDGDKADNGAAVLDLTVVVDGGTPQPVPDVTMTDVIAVPTDATSVDLTTTANGVTQTLSLLDGTPGPGNIAVLARANRFAAISGPASFEFTESAPGASVQRPANLTATAAGLIFWGDDGGTLPASAPDKTFLSTDLSYVYTTNSPPPFSGTNAGEGGGFVPQYLTLTLPDGTAIPAQALGNRSVFEVPANFTQGTITIAGAVTNPNNVTFAVPAPGISIAVNIPTS